MLQARVMPCLLVKNERLVKTIKFKNPSYIGDPINAIKIYNEKEVDELILLDITVTTEQKPPSFTLVSGITSECFMPLCYGGGIRTIDDIRRILNLGVEKVAVNSYAAENPTFIREASNEFGSQSIVVSIDVKKTIFRKYLVYTHGGRKATNLDPVDFAHRMQAMGAGEILLNSIDRDGTWEGYDLDLIRRVTQVVTIPVIACGGARNVSDFGKAVKKAGASAVAAGSMVVYQGKDLGVLISFPRREELETILI